MRPIYIILISFFFGTTLYGQSQASRFQTIQSDDQVFRIYEENGAMYSENCLKIEKCMAKATQISPQTINNLKSELRLTNPGDKICKLLGGMPFVGRFSNYDEQSFCLFGDKSFVDCGTLYAKALSADRNPNSVKSKPKNKK